MTEAAAAAVNHDANLANAVDSHLVCSPGVEDFVYDLHKALCSATWRCLAQSTREPCLDFRIVITCAKGSHLRQAPLFGALRHLGAPIRISKAA